MVGQTEEMVAAILKNNFSKILPEINRIIPKLKENIPSIKYDEDSNIKGTPKYILKVNRVYDAKYGIKDGDEAMIVLGETKISKGKTAQKELWISVNVNLKCFPELTKNFFKKRIYNLRDSIMKELSLASNGNYKQIYFEFSAT
ncbi:MAG: hypothetical protein ACP5NV_04360 [Candidatus Woesearchaeota archaeon]